MRSSLSCEYCRFDIPILLKCEIAKGAICNQAARRSKIKCVNNGTAPCQKCHRNGITTCVLSRPRKTPLKKTFRPPRQTEYAVQDPDLTDEHDMTRLSPVISAHQGYDRSRTQEAAHMGADKVQIDLHLSNLPNSVILKALNAFTNKFPELNILHHPWFMQGLHSSCPSESKTLLAAILAATRCHISRQGLPAGDSLLSREQYSSYVREMLSQSSFQSPNLQVAQALLIMSLYEWGSREFHRAWIYCGNIWPFNQTLGKIGSLISSVLGIAIRIMQAINSMRIAPYPADSITSCDRDPVSVAVENRTFWACFIMDRMISSGTYNPPMLPLSEIEKLKVISPLNAVEFAFGPDLSSQRSGMEGFPAAQPGYSKPLDITQAFEVLVSGFDIWAHVMTFVLNDGRRAPGMCDPPNCPWVPTSPWSRTRNRLETWRANQNHRLHYPENSVVAHTTLGFGESFTYINLIYYLCTLMLHREYFPFMPTTEPHPRGPVDHPKLQAEPPEEWWNTSALELFRATERISNLLHEASECGADVLTPFVGFSAFSAAYMNIYVFRFPQMNFGRSVHAEENLNYCLAYLEEFRQEWKLGESWMTTIKHASLLYQRAIADRSRYLGKSRADFDVLHQSIHEFRVVDRSRQHLQEMEGAERGLAPPTCPDNTPTNLDPNTPNSEGLNVPLNDLLTEVSTYAHEQGMWSHWWPSLEEVNLALFPDNS